MRPKQIWRIDNLLIVYAGAIILFIYDTSFVLFLFRSLPVCSCVRACLCQQNWILCELLSPNIKSGGYVLFAEKQNVITH